MYRRVRSLSVIRLAKKEKFSSYNGVESNLSRHKTPKFVGYKHTGPRSRHFIPT